MATRYPKRINSTGRFVDFNPHAPNASFILNSFCLRKQEKLYCEEYEKMIDRKKKLKELFIQNYLQEESELRQVDLSFRDKQI